MDKMQVLNEFWNSFEWPAYDQNTVPDNAMLPYITYEAATDDFNNELYLTASLWDRSTSWERVTLKEKEISTDISKGGRMILYSDGAMWIKMRSPWAQRMSDEDDGIRRILLSVTIEFIE